MNTLYDEKTLLHEIGIKRNVMYRRAKNLGYAHPLVVSCSQELDEMINRYHAIQD